MNQTLDPESRLVKNEKVRFNKLADRVATDAAKSILNRVENGSVELKRVKHSIKLFQFLQTGFGRMLFKREKFKNVMLRKVKWLEENRSESWWKRSHYRKTLRVELEKVRAILTSL